MKEAKRQVLKTIMRMFHRAAAEAEFADERPKKVAREVPRQKPVIRLRKPAPQDKSDSLLDDIASSVVSNEKE